MLNVTQSQLIQTLAAARDRDDLDEVRAIRESVLCKEAKDSFDYAILAKTSRLLGEQQIAALEESQFKNAWLREQVFRASQWPDETESDGSGFNSRLSAYSLRTIRTLLDLILAIPGYRPDLDGNGFRSQLLLKDLFHVLGMLIAEYENILVSPLPTPQWARVKRAVLQHRSSRPSSPVAAAILARYALATADSDQKTAVQDWLGNYLEEAK